MFAYGFNNPVNLSDKDGNWPKWATKVLIGVAVIAVCAAVTVATGGAAAGPLAAAVHCVAVGALKGAVIGAAVGAATGAAKGAVTHRIRNKTWKGAGKAALEEGATGFMTGAITGAITGGKNSKACFVAGTAVLAASGAVDIETIVAGDLVWSENPDTGERALKRVVQTFVNETDELVHVRVNGEEIITTPEHPFYVPSKGWTGAIHLRAGDILVLQNGKYIIVEQVQHEILEHPIKVYNFEVEDFHTYYVGDSSVLVHNVCGAKNTSDQTAVIKLAKEYKNGIGRTDADILVGWAKEYGLNYHYPMKHAGRSGIWSTVEHIKIFNVHIPVVE